MDEHIDNELCEEMRKYYHDRPFALRADIRVAVKLMAAYTAYIDIHDKDDVKIVKHWLDKPEELYDYWDKIGWVDPAIDLWHLVGEYNLNDDTDTAHIYVGHTANFIPDYMAVHLKEYNNEIVTRDVPLYYRFSCSGDDNEWDDYTVALFLPINWLVCMLNLYPDEIKNWRDE